jgi:hypothetical protein
MAKADLTAQRLREVLHYNPESGIFTWIAHTVKAGKQGGRRAKIGCEAGNFSILYCRIRIDRVHYLGHRLAWLYVHGEWPKQSIDHINGVKSDNRIANLREATPRLNAQNIRRAHSDSTSKLLGAYWIPRLKMWGSHICNKGQMIWLGNHRTPEAAHAAYMEAKRRLHEGCTI